MTTTCFTRKNEKRMVKIEVGQKKIENNNEKPSKTKNAKHKTARNATTTKMAPRWI